MVKSDLRYLGHPGTRIMSAEPCRVPSMDAEELARPWTSSMEAPLTSTRSLFALATAAHGGHSGDEPAIGAGFARSNKLALWQTFRQSFPGRRNHRAASRSSRASGRYSVPFPAKRRVSALPSSPTG